MLARVKADQQPAGGRALLGGSWLNWTVFFWFKRSLRRRSQKVRAHRPSLHSHELNCRLAQAAHVQLVRLARMASLRSDPHKASLMRPPRPCAWIERGFSPAMPRISLANSVNLGFYMIKISEVLASTRPESFKLFIII